jgi:hypothetical protein
MKAIALKRNLVIGLIVLFVGAFGVPSANSTDLNQGLVAYWNFNEGYGTTVHDATPNHHDGTIDGATWTTNGASGNALQFDGINDKVIVPDDNAWAFGSNDFTIVLWQNFDHPGGGSIYNLPNTFIANDEGNGSVNKWAFAQGGGYLCFHINAQSYPNNLYFPLVPFTPVVGQWYQFAVTRSGNTYTIYVNDGVGVSTVETHAVPNANAPLTIGWAEGSGTYASGRLDEIRIYSRALSEAEIQYLYNNPGGPNQPPTAVIDRIIPQNNEQGVGYLFEGHGTDQDGTIAGYNWRSDQDGQLSTEQSFTTTSLSVNTHRIYFKVQDDDGAWSDEDSTQYPGTDLRVYPSGTLDKHWEFPPEPYLWMGRENVFTFHALNQRPVYADYFDVLCGLNYTLQTSVPGFENTAWLHPEPWYPGADHYYPWGDTVLQQLAGGNSCKLHFKIKTHWDWIPPWNLLRIIDFILAFLPGVGSHCAELSNLENVAEAWTMAGNIVDVKNAADQMEETSHIGLHFHAEVDYTGVANSVMENPHSTEYVVPMDKLALWIDNVIVGVGAGWVTIVPLPFGLNYIIQAGMLIANEFVYVAAHDPDSSYTELVSPQFYFPPQLDSIPNGAARAAAYDVFRGVAYAEALKNSFAKYQGALVDANEEWAAKQLSSVALYSHLTSQTLRFLPSFLDTLIVQPTQGQIDSMKNSFATEGLPDLEESILAQYGCTQGAMDSMAAQYVALPNDYYMQAHQLPGLFQHAIGYLDSLSNYFPELPGNAKIADLGVDPDTIHLNNPPAILNCWVEFPKDSNITSYQIISAVLNDTIQASYISPTPGDYDNDGIPDIAMQFSTTMLIPMLQPGQRLLSVSGNLVLPSADTVLYSGSALLTIPFIRGDANRDGVVDISDVVYLLNYLFIHGPAPVPTLDAGDANCDRVVDASDLVYLLNYLFVNGPAPSCK